MARGGNPHGVTPLSLKANRVTPRRAVMFGMVVALELMGCARITRPPTTLQAVQQEAQSIAVAHERLRDSVLARLVRRAARRADGTLDLLMLSGGGQNGAYGAGFLRGWQRRTQDPMPTFDLITGISTGALQAPYAMLGTRDALDTISAMYARSATTIAPSLDWWFWLRPTGGFVNTKRYDRTVAATFNGTLREQLRAAFTTDQQIVFGTTDFDLGIGRFWSLGDELAVSTERVYTLIKGATAIPGIFPPVMVDGHLHADGGVIENLLPLLTFDDYQQLGTRLKAAGIPNVTVRLWVVMNLWSHAEPRVMKPSGRRAIDKRSTALLFYANQPSTLAGLENLTRAVSDRVPGVRLQLRVATLNAEESLSPGASALFDRRFLARLDSLGFAKAQSANAWDAVLPTAFSRPERTPRER